MTLCVGVCARTRQGIKGRQIRSSVDKSALTVDLSYKLATGMDPYPETMNE